MTGEALSLSSSANSIVGHGAATGHGASGDRMANAFPRAASDSGSEDFVVDEKQRDAQKTWKAWIFRHFKRFWLWYLIGAVILAAILLPLLFKVIVPAIVQEILNKQPLLIDYAGLFPVTGTTLLASLSAKLKIPLNIPINIDDTIFHLYNRDTPEYSPFINLTVPAQQFKGTAQITITNQSVPIANYTEALKWLGQAFDQAEVDVSTKASLSAHIGALHYTPNIDKTVKLPGLRQLDGLQIGDLKINFGAAKNTTNIEGTLLIPNWSALDLFLGNITLDLLSGDLKLGYALLNDVRLPHNTNTTCSLTGFLDLSTAISNLGSILNTQAPFLKDGNLQLLGHGTSCVINGERIKIVEDLLATRRLKVPVSVVSLLMDVAGSIIPGQNATGILGSVGSVLGNHTLLENALNRMNKTRTKEQQSQNKLDAAKAKRDSPENIMWHALRTVMKMKRVNHIDL